MRWCSAVGLFVLLLVLVGGAFFAGTQVSVWQPEEPSFTQHPNPPPKAVSQYQAVAPAPLVILATQMQPAADSVKPSQPVKQAEAISSPPVQLVNDPELILTCQVLKVGSSGLKSIEVWITRDEGATWRMFAEDPKPLPVKAGIYRPSLRLPEDGVYGIRLAFLSNAGRGKPPPVAGDQPDMTVELDTVAPVGKIHKPVPDLMSNTLMLTWTAEDRNLGPTPITLSWAEKSTGPWQAIAVNVLNTGKYYWTLPPNLPAYVIVKMRMQDRAGNVAEVTSERELVDLTDPVVRLIGVTPAKSALAEVKQ
jgi:hypothetical protein